MADGFGARWEAVGFEFLVFEDEALEEAFLSCDVVEGFDVEFAELFDVDWAAVLLLLVESVLVTGRGVWFTDALYLFRDNIAGSIC